MNSYRFSGGSEQQAFGPLPPGDYSFEIAQCDEPYEKNDKWILPVRITIKPQGQTVFANAWTGQTRDGEMRDGIGDLLLCVNRAPALGKEPDWRRLVGAQGRCRLKIEIAQMGALAGKEKNTVAFFHRPKQVGPTADQPPRQSYSQAEVEKAAQDARRRAGGSGNEIEPEDIPFGCDRG